MHWVFLLLLKTKSKCLFNYCYIKFCSLSKESKHQCFCGNIMNYISNKIFLLHPEEQDSLHYALVENHRRVIFPNHTLFSTKSCSTRRLSKIQTIFRNNIFINIKQLSFIFIFILFLIEQFLLPYMQSK